MTVQSEDPSLNNAGAPRPDGVAPQPGDPHANPLPDVEGDEVEKLRAELAELEQKADEYLRLAQRTQADFINYRRRMDEERAQQARDAGLSVLQRLFPILDDFERAMANASSGELESNWGQGVSLVERNLRSLLAAEGVEEVAADGKEFDPRFHEAVGSAPSGDVPEGHVLHVARKGYRKGERVLRPTQVVVARRSD